MMKARLPAVVAWSHPVIPLGEPHEGAGGEAEGERRDGRPLLVGQPG